MTLNRRQVAKVKTAIKQLELPDEIYRDMLAELGVTSCTELDNEGADRLYGWFRQLGFRDSNDRGEQFDEADRAGMASNSQLNFLRHLWKTWAATGDLEGLPHWLERAFGVTAVRFLDRETASKAIQGLQAMHRRKDPASLPRRDGRRVRQKRIATDLEVAAFLEVEFGRAWTGSKFRHGSLKRIVEAASGRFGKERVGGPSNVKRFSEELKERLRAEALKNRVAKPFEQARAAHEEMFASTEGRSARHNQREI